MKKKTFKKILEDKKPFSMTLQHGSFSKFYKSKTGDVFRDLCNPKKTRTIEKDNMSVIRKLNKKINNE